VVDEAKRAADLLMRFYVNDPDGWPADLVAAVERGGMNVAALRREARREWKRLSALSAALAGQQNIPQPAYRDIDEDGVIEAIVVTTTTRQRLG
jgi:hypothetical protein